MPKRGALRQIRWIGARRTQAGKRRPSAATPSGSGWGAGACLHGSCPQRRLVVAEHVLRADVCACGGAE